jgi:hypothetical protein
MVLAIGHAWVLGMTEAAGDPFTHIPSAQSALAALSDEIAAADTITSEDWRRVYDDGVAASSRGSGANAAVISACLLNLNRYARAEKDTLCLYLLAAGSPVRAAEAIASTTVATGIAACVLGEPETWAGRLARTNNRSLAGLSIEAATACRTFQATSFKRFAKIRDLDDIESVNEEQQAQKIALKRLATSCEGENSLILR